MPRELPELMGEPLGFGEAQLTQIDGSDMLIEKAFSLNDVCSKLKGKLHQRKVLLCFATSPQLGECIAILDVLDRENADGKRLLSFWSIPLRYLQEDACETNLQLKTRCNLLLYIKRQYGITEDQLLKLLENIQ